MRGGPPPPLRFTDALAPHIIAKGEPWRGRVVGHGAKMLRA